MNMLLEGPSARVVARVMVVLAVGVLWSLQTAGQAHAETLFAQQLPQTIASSDAAAVEVGVRFRSTTAGVVTSVRFFKGPGNGGTHVGSLWSSSGIRLGKVTFSDETVLGWQQADFTTPLAIAANTTYVVSVHAPRGRYAVTEQFFSGTWSAGILSAPSKAGVYRYGPAGSFPDKEYRASNYWIDVVVRPKDTTAPTAPGDLISSDLSPTSVRLSWGASSDDVGVTGYEILRDGSVVGTTTTGERSWTFGGLREATGYAFGVRAFDAAGNRSTTSVVRVTTPPAPTTFSLMAPTSAPASHDVGDDAPVELGVRFRSDVAGFVRGVRFYKPRAGTVVRSVSLWTASGARLATGAVARTRTSGWQAVQFAQPVRIAVGTSYVASYEVRSGMYAATPWAFLRDGIDRGPLHAPRSTATSGNGVFRLGSGFPSLSHRASNYWVDVDVARDVTPSVTLVPRVVGDGAEDAAWQRSATDLVGAWVASGGTSAVTAYDYCFTTADRNDCSAPLPGTGTSGTGPAFTAQASGLSLSTAGTSYRVCVRARFSAGGEPGPWACSAGTRVDDAPPAAPTAVRDGAAGTDASWVTSSSSYASTWVPATDGAGSGVQRHDWCLTTLTGCVDGVVLAGTLPGAAAASISLSSLQLVEGATYRSCVRAVDVVGNVGAYGCSDGAVVDTVAPSSPAVADGTGVGDATWQASTTELSASWGLGFDATSGMASYDWCFTTVLGAQPCLQPVGGPRGSGTGALARTQTVAGLDLTADGTTYYACVRGRDQAGNVAATWSCSDGVRIDTAPPSAPAPTTPPDGTDLEAGVTSVMLSWAASVDPQAGVAGYEYRFAPAGALDGAPWQTTPATTVDVPVTSATGYAWQVRARDAVGNVSVPSSTRRFSTSGVPPTLAGPEVVLDGETGDDLDASTRADLLAAHWSRVATPNGIDRYEVCYGTDETQCDLVDWVPASSALKDVRSGLALTNGTRWVACVRAVDGASTVGSATCSDGVALDLDAPSEVRDGPGAVDVDSLRSTDRFDATWHLAAGTGTATPEACLERIGAATPCDVVPWEAARGARTHRFTGLELGNGAAYRVCVRTVGGPATCSDGATIDATPPAGVVGLRDGAGTEDVDWIAPYADLLVTWQPSASTDVVRQEWCLTAFESCDAGAVTGWTSLAPSATRAGTAYSPAGIVAGVAYRACVRAVDAAGNTSIVSCTDGQAHDT